MNTDTFEAVTQQVRTDWRRDIVLIPADYTGWVKIEYGVADTPPLDMQNGRYVVQVDRHGKAVTLTPAQSRQNTDEYFLAQPDGSLAPVAEKGEKNTKTIHHVKFESRTDGNKTRNFKTFYIGTEEQYSEAAKSDDDLFLT